MCLVLPPIRQSPRCCTLFTSDTPSRKKMTLLGGIFGYSIMNCKRLCPSLRPFLRGSESYTGKACQHFFLLSAYNSFPGWSGACLKTKYSGSIALVSFVSTETLRKRIQTWKRVNNCLGEMIQKKVQGKSEER